MDSSSRQALHGRPFQENNNADNDVRMADDLDDMPGLEEVSDSSESSDNDSDDAMHEDNNNEDDDGTWTDVDSDMPPLEPISAPSRSALPQSQPQGRRRARVEDDEDDERDRRHPSQRLSSATNNQTAASSSSGPRSAPLPFGPNLSNHSTAPLGHTTPHTIPIHPNNGPLVISLPPIRATFNIPFHPATAAPNPPTGNTNALPTPAPTNGNNNNTNNTPPPPFRFFQHFMNPAQQGQNNQNHNQNHPSATPRPQQHFNATPAGAGGNVPGNGNGNTQGPMNGGMNAAFLQNLLGGIAIHINLGPPPHGAQGGNATAAGGQQQAQGQDAPTQENVEDNNEEEGSELPPPRNPFQHPHAAGGPFLPVPLPAHLNFRAGPPPPGGGPLPQHGQPIPANFRTFIELLAMLAGARPVPEQEQEDHERAEKLVRGMEAVPVGLVRRLERVGKFLDGSGKGEEEGVGAGDGGCAVCWEQLVEEGEEEEPHEKDKEDEEGTTKDGDEGTKPLSPPLPRIVALPCAHVFHSACLLPWFARPRQTTCPTCRFNIDPENLTYISWARRMETERRRAAERERPNAVQPAEGADAPQLPTPTPPAAPAETPAPSATAEAGPRMHNGPIPLPPLWGRAMGLQGDAVPTRIAEMGGMGFFGPLSFGVVGLGTGPDNAGPPGANAQGAGATNAGAGTDNVQNPEAGGNPNVNPNQGNAHADPPLSPLPGLNLPNGDYITIGFDVVWGPPPGEARHGPGAAEQPAHTGVGVGPTHADMGVGADTENPNAEVENANPQPGANPQSGANPQPGASLPQPGQGPRRVGMFDFFTSFVETANAGPGEGQGDNDNDDNAEVGALPFPFPIPFGMAPPRHTAPGVPREDKAWVPPPPPGPTLRQRIESKEREAGLRCYDVSCGIGPSDDDPYVALTEQGMRQFSIHECSGAEEELKRVCAHTFHLACLVSAERVALRGAEAAVVGDDVEVSCPVCRGTGCVSKKDWDEGVKALA